MPEHRKIWEEINGAIPEGMHIHHKDCNHANNAIENLELVTPKEHRQRHVELWNKEIADIKRRIKRIVFDSGLYLDEQCKAELGNELRQILDIIFWKEKREERKRVKEKSVKAAQELGKLGKGIPKTLTPKERRRRSLQLIEARKKRWPKK